MLDTFFRIAATVLGLAALAVATSLVAGCSMAIIPITMAYVAFTMIAYKGI